MQCVKTGAHIRLEQYGLWALCDAFKMDEVYLFRVVAVSFEGPFRDVKHYSVGDVAQWFDKNREGHVSTVIASGLCSNVIDYGYEGKAI